MISKSNLKYISANNFDFFLLLKYSWNLEKFIFSTSEDCEELGENAKHLSSSKNILKDE